jgi:hypothetical protein
VAYYYYHRGFHLISISLLPGTQLSWQLSIETPIATEQSYSHTGTIGCGGNESCTTEPNPPQLDDNHYALILGTP